MICMRTLRWWTGLSPRRRILFGGLALAVAVAAAVVGLQVSRGQPEAVPGRPGAVILVPGYGGSTGSLDKLAARIRQAGRTATVVQLAGDGTGDLTVQAHVLDGYVNRAIGAGSGPVTVIGYSAGGVVAWLWYVDYGGAVRTGNIITLGSPLHGARIAAVGAAYDPAVCPVACQQLAPGSALLDPAAGIHAGAAALAVAVEYRRSDGAATGFGEAARRGERAAPVRLPERGYPAQPAAHRAARRRHRAARPRQRPRRSPRGRRLRGPPGPRPLTRGKVRSLYPASRSSPRRPRGTRPRTPPEWRTRAEYPARRSAAGRSRSTRASTGSAGTAAPRSRRSA